MIEPNEIIEDRRQDEHDCIYGDQQTVFNAPETFQCWMCMSEHDVKDWTGAYATTGGAQGAFAKVCDECGGVV